ncbi:MFS transporter [Woodsholea maritima]|uniref:MFS transporter n=1 Tax=Woodsholea maritima TaxID=240237 RepID=UPI00036F755A|nr:MFS transporter [Woodsholea maritima]
MIATFLMSPDHARVRALTTAMLCAALCGCGFGLLMPLASLNLEAMTGSATLSGLITAAAAISNVCAVPLVPVILQKVHPRRALVFSSASIAVVILMFPLMPNPWIWFVLRLLIGISITLIFISSESWINQLAEPKKRASLLAIYATVLSLGIGLGSLLIAALGWQGWLPWVSAALIYGLGVIPVMILKGPDLIPPSAKETGLKALWLAALASPAAIVAGAVYGAIENAMLALLPIYAERLALPTLVIGTLLAVGTLGAIVLQIPVGKLADRFGRAKGLLWIAVASVILPLIMWISGTRLWLLYPLCFVYLGLAGGFYTLGLARIGERFSGGAIATANSAFILAYGVGQLAGPLSAGAMMDHQGPQGLMWALSAMALLYFLIVLQRQRTKPH